MTPEVRVVDPFPADDPLAYDELSSSWLVMRALLAVLADTGAQVSFPAQLFPGWMEAQIAAGWRLDVRRELAPQDVVVMSAQWRDAPARPGEGS